MRFHISQKELEKNLGVTSMAQAIRTRQLRWGGHVARMDFERLPRKFLSAWVVNPRRRGRPQFTYGHSLEKQLRMAQIDTDRWTELAQDRIQWRKTIQPHLSDFEARRRA